MNRVIRCAPPDCDWGRRMKDLSEQELKLCYAEFRKHCVEVHGLQEGDLGDSRMFLDLGQWTLTLLK